MNIAAELALWSTAAIMAVAGPGSSWKRETLQRQSLQDTGYCPVGCVPESGGEMASVYGPCTVLQKAGNPMTSMAVRYRQNHLKKLSALFGNSCVERSEAEFSQNVNCKLPARARGCDWNLSARGRCRDEFGLPSFILPRVFNISSSSQTSCALQLER